MLTCESLLETYNTALTRRVKKTRGVYFKLSFYSTALRSTCYLPPFLYFRLTINLPCVIPLDVPYRPGCAGIFTGHAAIELYCEVFDNEGVLDRFVALPSCALHYWWSRSCVVLRPRFCVKTHVFVAAAQPVSAYTVIFCTTPVLVIK